MSNPNQKLQDAIDLLAEGAMDARSRDELFVRLDMEPNGWRSCALALLEQRALHQSIGGPAAYGSLLSIGATGATTKTWHTPSWQSLVSIAAMALILIAVGWVAGERTGSNNRIVSVNPSNDHSSDQSTMAALQIDDELMRQVSFALESTGSSDAELVAMVRVGDESSKRFFPIVRSNELAQKITAMPEPKLTREATHKLHQSGWELNKHQQFISFKLPNGITKALPVDMLTYRYVGRETF